MREITFTVILAACFHLRKCCSTSFQVFVGVNDADFGEFDFVLCWASVPMMPLTLGFCFYCSAGNLLCSFVFQDDVTHYYICICSIFFPLDWQEVKGSGGEAPGGETEDAAETWCSSRKSKNLNSNVKTFSCQDQVYQRRSGSFRGQL